MQTFITAYGSIKTESSSFKKITTRDPLKAKRYNFSKGLFCVNKQNTQKHVDMLFIEIFIKTVKQIFQEEIIKNRAKVLK